MASLSKNVLHEYDPAIVFQTHSTNLPHLSSWIEELIHLSETSLPSSSNPSTDQLVESLQRYDAIFRELFKQTSIFSDPLSRLLTKTWTGSLKLVDYVIKSYHRYVKHTAHLQTQSQQLLNDRQAQKAASKVRAEEFELERTALRAKIRVLESEVEALQANNRIFERENSQVRSVVSAYIKSEEFNNDIWALVEEFQNKVPIKIDEGDEHVDRVVVGFNRKETIDAGKDHLRQLNRLEIEVNEILSNVLREEDRQRLLVSELMSLMDKYKAVFGPGEWSNGRYYAGETNAVETRDVYIQVDEKDNFGVVDDGPEISSSEDTTDLSIVPPSPNLNFKINGGEIPFQLRKLMFSFPRVLRIPPAAWVCQTIMSIYLSKIRYDEVNGTGPGMLKMTMSEYVFVYFNEILGQKSVADVQVTQFIKACDYHMSTIRRVAMFASQIGLYDREKYPSMDARDSEYVLSVIAHVIAQVSLVDTRASFSSSTISRKKTMENRMTLKAEISRTVAAEVVHVLFEKWLPDGGHDYVIKVKSMNPTDKSGRMIDMDEFLEVMLEPWNTMRLTWEEHARYLFSVYCNVHSVISEAQFATDGGLKDRDSVLIQIQKTSSNDCFRRPIRLFQVNDKSLDRNDESNNTAAGGVSGSVNQKKYSLGNPKKEQVCDTMTRKLFGDVINIIDPNISANTIDHYFKEACLWSHQSALRSLELIWAKRNDNESYNVNFDMSASFQSNAVLEKRKPTFQDYYINLKSVTTQWTKPYRPRTFFCHEIELNAFLTILLHRDILASSPLTELLHLSPKDLWPNADMFMKQIEELKLKALRNAELEAAAAALIADDEGSVNSETSGSVGTGTKRGKSFRGKGRSVSSKKPDSRKNAREKK